MTRSSRRTGWRGSSPAPCTNGPLSVLVGPVSNTAPDAQGIRPGYAQLTDLDAFAAQRRQAYSGQLRAVHRLTGFCLLVRREVLERIGGFDERFGAGFFDDDDLCVRTARPASACW